MDRSRHPQSDQIREQINLGPKSAAMLAAAGIHSLEQLRELGAVAAYVRVKRLNKNASLNLLYALVGALEGCDWRAVQRERKLELLIAIEDFEKRHSLVQQALAADMEIECTGKVYPAKDVHAWMHGLAQGKSTKRPKPSRR